MITMRALIERAERHFPANPAIVPATGTQGAPLTWAEFAIRVRRAAGALRSLGVEAGDRFAIVCRNDPRQAELIHAGYWMGAVPAPINYRLAPVEIAAILEGISPRLVAVEDHWTDLATGPPLAGRREPLLWIGRGGAVRPDAPDYETLRDDTSEDEGRVSVEGDDALLLYTGGTTGRAKGGAAHPPQHCGQRPPARRAVLRRRGRRDAARRADVPFRGSPRLSVLPHRCGPRLPAGIRAGCLLEGR